MWIQTIFSTLVAISICFSGRGALCASVNTSHGLTIHDWTTIDHIVTTAVRCRNIPGLNLAVTNNGNTFYRSYGYADYQNKIPLRPETRICIGSLGKSFTTALVAIILSEHKHRYPLKWNTPLKDIFGNGFQLSDTFRTEYATLRDLAAHRMGWFDFDMPRLTGLDESHTRLQYCRRFRYLRDRTGFREMHLYSNDGYILLGCAVEVMANEEYEVVMRQKLLDPLGMNSTLAFSNITDWTSEQESKLHINDGNGFVVVPTDLLGSTIIMPAGGYCSNSPDMAKWMYFQHTFRTAQGEVLADDDILSEMHDNQVSVPVAYSFASRPKMAFSDQIYGYGLGWYVSSYRDGTNCTSKGYRTLWHGGLMRASMSHARFYKDIDLGVVSVTNIRSAEVMLALVLIHSYIADLALGINPWINESTICSYSLPETPISKGLPPALHGFIPSRDLLVCNTSLTSPACLSMGTHHAQIPEWAHVYVGHYGHPLWTNFTVTFNQSTGHLDATNGNSYLGRMVLYPTFNASVFLIRHCYPLSPYVVSAEPNRLASPVVFSSVRNGRYTRLSVPKYGDYITAVVFWRDLKWDGAQVITENQHPSDTIG